MARKLPPDYAPPLNVPEVGVFTRGTFPGVPRRVYKASIKLYEHAAPGLMRLTFPRGADVRGPQMRTGPDVIEFPLGTGCTYEVVQVDDVGYPFPNRRRFAVVTYFGRWPDLGRPDPGNHEPE